MRLLVLWLHVLGVVVWLGGLVYQVHVMVPAARRGQVAAFTTAARRARPVAWTALGLIVLTGFDNVTRLGPLDRVMESGGALALVAKLMLVLVIVALAAQRDFGQLPRLARDLAAGTDTGPALRTIAWLDRIVVLLGVVTIYLGLAVSRS
jgi:uncharacterized membrane protein